MNLYCGRCRALTDIRSMEEVIVNGDAVWWCDSCVREAGPKGKK